MNRDATAVDALIAEGLLAPAARDRGIEVVHDALVRTEESAEPGPAHTAVPQLVEVVAYLGGALVLAAGALFVAQQWQDLPFGARVTLLVAVTLVLAAAGAVSARVPGGTSALLREAEDTRRRLAGALFTGAGLAAAFLVGYVTDEVLDVSFPEIYWPAVIGAAAGMVLAAVGYRVAPTAVGVVGLLAGLCTVVVQLASGVDTAGSEGDAAGVAFFLAGAGWLVLTELGVFRELTVARTLGVALTLFGAQVPAIDGTHAWLGYLLTSVVAVGGVAAYLRTHAWPYLAGAVLGVTVVVPEAVADWTDGSLGAVGGVLVAGITLLAASLGGYRLRSRTHPEQEPRSD